MLRPHEFARHATLARYPCAPELDHWVENYWSVRWDLPPGRGWPSATLPHPACNLSVEHGQARPGVGPGPVVTGVVTRRFEVLLRDRGWVFGAKFRPGGLTSLTGVPARVLRDTTVPAAEVVPPSVVASLSTLGPEATDEACRAAYDVAWADTAGATDRAYALVLDVVSAMLGDRGLQRVAQVEERCGLSARRLQRLFASYVGVSPKWVLARYRMHDVVDELDSGYDGSLADLAARYGWFDQAHFTREFTRLIGVSPGTYVQDARDRPEA